MAGRLTEEQITKQILIWLEANGWEIICFDFPQSGTGISMHPNEDIRLTKNKKAIIPDIIAVKNSQIVFFENKDRFVFNDLVKIQSIKNENHYSTAFQKLLKGIDYTEIFFGVGLPETVSITKNIIANSEMMDFALLVASDGRIVIGYEVLPIFSF